MDKELNVNFSESSLYNLKIFLERVNLKGKEVPIYVEIINKINDTLSKKDE